MVALRGPCSDAVTAVPVVLPHKEADRRVGSDRAKQPPELRYYYIVTDSELPMAA
jgi:hypothetical protein